MSEQVTRRTALAAAAGVVGTAVVTGSAAGQEKVKKPEGLPKEAWAFAEAPGKTTATVYMCRSWDPHAYIVCDDGAKGYVSLAGSAHGIAAACEAAGKKIWVRYWGYDPSWGNGAGYFQGAKVSVNDHPEL